MLKIRGELPRSKRVTLSTISVVTFLCAWWFLTLPILPPSEESQLVAPDTVSATAADAEVTSSDVAVKAPEMRPIIPAYILPSPMAVLNSIVYLHTKLALVRSALVSIYRITAAFLLSVIAAVPLGLLMATYPPIKNVIEPLTGPLRFLPISAITPLFILWFGIDNMMKISFLFVGVVVYLLPMVVEAVNNVEQTYVDTAYTLGAKPRQVIWRVLLPGAWPGIFEACRVLYGVGWTYLILAELINPKYGLGYLLTEAQRRSHIDWIYALILVVLALGVGTNFMFVATGRQLFAWKEES